MSNSKHLQAVEEAKNAEQRGTALLSDRKRRPRLSSRPSVHSNQLDLHAFYTDGAPDGSSSGGGLAGESISRDNPSLLASRCWGYRRPHAIYGGISYSMKSLLEDRHLGVDWYLEPHLNAYVRFYDHDIEVHGTFRHRMCCRVSSSVEGFPDLTCNFCAEIPRLVGFRLSVIREDKSIVKRGSRTSFGGIRVGYL